VAQIHASRLHHSPDRAVSSSSASAKDGEGESTGEIGGEMGEGGRGGRKGERGGREERRAREEARIRCYQGTESPTQLQLPVVTDVLSP